MLSAPGFAGDDATDLVAEPHRDRREDVVLRAAADEKVGDRAMRVVVAALPTRSPSDDLQLVVVTVADDVAAGVGEAAHDGEIARRRGPVHGVRVVAALARVRIEPAIQEQIHAPSVSFGALEFWSATRRRGAASTRTACRE